MAPCVSVSRKLSILAGFAGALALAGAAQAATLRGPNYKFDDGAAGFRLQTKGGPVNPGVWVGFNPQPEPPGDFAPNALNAYKPSSADFTNPFAPVFLADRNGASFIIELYTTLGDGSVRPLGKPDSHNSTGFRQNIGGHDISFRFDFGGLVAGSGGYQTGGSGFGDGGGAGFGDGGGAGFGDGGGAGRWFPTRGRADPPGEGVAAQFTLPTGQIRPTGLAAFGAGANDVFVHLTATVDGQALSFSATPEPGAWAFMIVGFGGAGVVLRRRRAAAATA